MFDLPEPPSTPVMRLRMALAMFGDGWAMMRQRLRREFPGETEEQIDERVAAWLHSRPGAENGDADGRPRHWDPGC